MTTTEATPGTKFDARDNNGRTAGSHLLTTTETRRSTKTSELWLAVASFAAIVAAGYFSDALSVDRAWLFATVVMAAYLVSRGLAKVGSSDPTVRDLDVRR